MEEILSAASQAAEEVVIEAVEEFSEVEIVAAEASTDPSMVTIKEKVAEATVGVNLINRLPVENNKIKFDN